MDGWSEFMWGVAVVALVALATLGVAATLAWKAIREWWVKWD